ncbi:MAG: tetratricopeptide repeat protein, partial [Leptolyngbyaceae cyanobacterium RM2_2_4]|nr:tetratricopeptide repeat protein [Leptolyngbyaceae cyanobacterium RM2_2_4]
KLEQAMVCYRRALEQNPSFSEAYHNLGEALGRQQNWQERSPPTAEPFSFSPTQIPITAWAKFWRSTNAGKKPPPATKKDDKFSNKFSNKWLGALLQPG